MAAQKLVFKRKSMAVFARGGAFFVPGVRPDDNAALSRDGISAIKAIPAQMIINAPFFFVCAKKLRYHAFRVRFYMGQRGFGLRVHALNARPGGHVVELLFEQGFPKRRYAADISRHFSVKQLPRLMVFGDFERDFRLSDAAFGSGLRGQRPPVPGEVQFALVYIFYRMLPVKKRLRAFQTAARRAFKVQTAPGLLRHIARRAAAAVAIAVREQHSLDVLRLNAIVLPAGDQFP